LTGRQAPAELTPAQVAQRERNLQNRYGIGQAEYDALITLQLGRCMICGATPHKGLVVDHDHVSGKVRGLLCTHCNLTLGHCLESVDILARAVAYLTGSLTTAPTKFLGDLSRKETKQYEG
jgi:hypothetical protein